MHMALTHKKREVLKGTHRLEHGECLSVLSKMPTATIHALVTDPPYGLRFMGAQWDYDVPSVEVWRERLRVLRPGGYMLCFAHARTYHRMAVNIEDAGFEIVDQVMWLYGQGFPKSLDIRKALDKKGSEGAEQWEGWGTALKPCHEPIVVARKPLQGNYADNVKKWKTGGINIDACRVGDNPGYKYRADRNGTTFHGKQGARIKQSAAKKGAEVIESTKGRWPGNLIHDGSEEVLERFPRTKSSKNGGDIGDEGSAARFFYCAKASVEEREQGLQGSAVKKAGTYNMRTDQHSERTGAMTAPRKNHHPTVKPLALMRYLCRLVTPPDGVVLDPYMGTGTTGCAALMEGFRFVGVEVDEDYFKLAEARVKHWSPIRGGT